MTTSPRFWYAGGGAAAALIVVIGWFLLISPQNAQTADLRSQSADARLANSTLQHKIAELNGQNGRLDQYKAALARTQQALPQTDGMADFLRSLQTMATGSVVHITALTVGSPTDLVAPTASSPTSAGPHVYTLPITLDAAGSITQLTDFLTQLQTVQPRAVLVTQIDQKAGTQGADVTLGVTLQAFVATGR